MVKIYIKKNAFRPYLHSSIVCTHQSLEVRGNGSYLLYSSYTMNRLPVHHRHTPDKHQFRHAHTHTPLCPHTQSNHYDFGLLEEVKVALP